MKQDYTAKLTDEQRRVLAEKGTEAPFSGEFLKHTADGMFRCVACGAELFASSSKYESNIAGLQGWPSFADVANSDAVELVPDHSLGMERVEVTCKTCGGHLGHVFDDPSSPTGQHYCINSCVLDFKPK